MSQPVLSMEEIAQRGDEIYATRLRSRLEGQHDGQIVVIDVETGDYEIDVDSLTANNRALAKRPGVNLYGMRVGADVVEKFSIFVKV